ncbi:MAG: hypothetical protein R2830_19110 [Saprospiraceae bacterium]
MLTEQEIAQIFRGKKKRTANTKDANGSMIKTSSQGFEHTTLEQFKAWFEQSNFEQGCKYCGTTNEQSFRLYTAARNSENAGVDWTRGGKRGRRLEIDRLNPALPYDNLSNLVWCCYWCNNAKSNFFTAEEFQPIANQIGLALKKMLQ